MKELINYLFDFGNEPLLNYQQGFVSGVIVFAGILLTYLIIRSFLNLFKSSVKKAAGVTIRSAHGDLYITSAAISDMIKAMKKEFPYAIVNKVELIEVKNEFNLNIYITFDMAGGDLTDLVGKLRTKIFADLRCVFGIESVSEINVKLRKAINPTAKVQPPIINAQVVPAESEAIAELATPVDTPLIVDEDIEEVDEKTE